jgi:hypothetical protein
MIKGRIECRGARAEKVANCLARFSLSFPSEFEGLAYGDKFFIKFKLESVSAYKEFLRRLKRIKGIKLKFPAD